VRSNKLGSHQARRSGTQQPLTRTLGTLSVSGHTVHTPLGLISVCSRVGISGPDLNSLTRESCRSRIPCRVRGWADCSKFGVMSRIHPAEGSSSPKYTKIGHEILLTRKAGDHSTSWLRPPWWEWYLGRDHTTADPALPLMFIHLQDPGSVHLQERSIINSQGRSQFESHSSVSPDHPIASISSSSVVTNN